MDDLVKKVLETIKYCQDTGKCYRISCGVRYKRYEGKEAGYINFSRGEYRWYIKVNSKPHLRTKIAFILMMKRKPILLIDHINHNSLDDRWENLREVTPSENQLNRRNKDYK